MRKGVDRNKKRKKHTQKEKKLQCATWFQTSTEGTQMNHLMVGRRAEAAFSLLWLRGQEHVGLFYIEPSVCLDTRYKKLRKTY